jgi:hypothetical protein
MQHLTYFYVNNINITEFQRIIQEEQNRPTKITKTTTKKDQKCGEFCYIFIHFLLL